MQEIQEALDQESIDPSEQSRDFRHNIELFGSLQVEERSIITHYKGDTDNFSESGTENSDATS